MPLAELTPGITPYIFSIQKMSRKDQKTVGSAVVEHPTSALSSP
jgi:hypothetical protein